MVLRPTQALATPKTDTSGDGSASQATGAPDVKVAGDNPRAWASAVADAGHDWLEVVFAESVVAADDDVVIWEGDDPTGKALSDRVVPQSSVHARTWVP